MRIEVLTWEEIQVLPEFIDGSIETLSTYWNAVKELKFVSKHPDRIVKLLQDEPDTDGDYECADTYYPSCIIRRFIPDGADITYGTHRILRRSPHGIPV